MSGVKSQTQKKGEGGSGWLKGEEEKLLRIPSERARTRRNYILTASFVRSGQDY